ncbi:type I-A CRISPR-associated protein Cas4/Csa1 [Aeropyrum camini]|uniref:CRISPR-associated protein Cas1 family n=1 Tax=Aeropyrum camini SY1 = JCM 12091 TaxID=1198449 RepID=U3TBL8_9CREN|nr:type I-A CRISPR-associated protein Cas4/Csa1 [Aeropyrum camini]BAN89816.1 CRISPR-associated protein Cas1 family [Aeropyrum camini SY1 = JCM 12091]
MPLHRTIRLQLRRLHDIAASNPVSPELRGWRWDSPPVKPKAYLGLGVSEVAYRYCPTYRDLYLRRRGVRPEITAQVEAGSSIHEAFHRAARGVRGLLMKGYPPWRAAYILLSSSRETGLSGAALELYRQLVVMWTGEAAASQLEGREWGVGWLPWLSEYLVDGSAIGLSSRLRVDGLAEAGVVVEIKYGWTGDRHMVGLAGYALALESQLEVPIDYGILVSVRNGGGGLRVSSRPVYIDDVLRTEFIDARDEAIEVLLSGGDPGMPRECPSSCLFYNHCRGGR